MYIADLHIHSKYSRATSRQCVPEYLELWARRKGISLLGTGDFTHQAWREELFEKLEPAEEGLYTLKPEFRLEDPAAPGDRPRFAVTGEISSIYKKDGKTRKVHSLILLPSLEAAEALARRLAAIGNIHSDGRPILGLDCRDLLEIAMEACGDTIFIPAHIWTPHFSVFGAFSAFSSLEECFGDMTPHIRALETGLSSDPPMNWRVSGLDGYTLVSNSDAHSPAKLGREANLLDCAMSYPALKAALEQGAAAGFGGTIEFFPEEGKYHFDGHRNCHLCLRPEETEKFGGRCPVCGRKITVGVQHRVEELADRPEGFVPEGAGRFESLVPLPEVIAAAHGISPASVKAAREYDVISQKLGAEFYILRQAPIEDISLAAGPCIAEGIARLRQGRIERIPGYDGEYGKIRIFDEAEISRFSGQMSFLSPSELCPEKPRTKAPAMEAAAAAETNPEPETMPDPKAQDPLAELNPEQLAAVTAPDRAVAVIAGPGTGKTKTLVARIAYLIERRGVKPGEITAVTFTNKAAGEMRQRLEARLGGKSAVRNLTVGTFHRICMDFLRGRKTEFRLAGDFDRRRAAEQVIAEKGLDQKPEGLLQEISRVKNGAEDAALEPGIREAYDQILREDGFLDLDDLLCEALRVWESGQVKAGEAKGFSYILVDEFQDINPVQYRLIQCWSQRARSLFVIGDPDQAIYGFRGSAPACFDTLAADREDLRSICLTQNYRSTPEILGAAADMIAADGIPRQLTAQRPAGGPVRVYTASGVRSEAIFVAKEINRMVGGLDMLDAHHGDKKAREQKLRDFSDIAVLCRTHRQGALIESCLRQEGIPYTVTGGDRLLAAPEAQGVMGFFRFLLCRGDSTALKQALTCLWDCSAAEAEQTARLLRADGNGPWSAEELEERLAQTSLPAAGHLLQMAKLYLPRLKKEKPARLLEDWQKAHDLTDSEAMDRLVCTAVFHATMAEFLDVLLLGQEGDLARSGGKRYRSGAVRVMTLHGSKGLEFPVVFLCGVTREWLPLDSPGRPADPAEERRLFYVGMTRAKEALYLLTSREPSPYLADIPAEYLEKVEPDYRAAPAAKQISMFDSLI